MGTAARLTIMMAAFVFCAACSARIVPQPTATAVFNPADNSLTENHDGIAITARIDELSVQPYQLVDNLTAFYIVVDNQTGHQVSVPPESFVLRDAEGRQHRNVTPERVMEIVSKDTVYLIPYPYVGYYYLEDQERSAFVQSTASSLPFYAEYHPQDIFAHALPVGPILPRSKISGVIYFLVDLTLTDRSELLVFRNTQLTGDPRYRFPFAVEK